MNPCAANSEFFLKSPQSWQSFWPVLIVLKSVGPKHGGNIGAIPTGAQLDGADCRGSRTSPHGCNSVSCKGSRHICQEARPRFQIVNVPDLG